MEEDHHINKRRKIQNIIINNDYSTKFTRMCIKMYCPKSSKIAEIMAWEDQRLDLGTIARMFGIEPVTLRLNGHLISRGVDLIASSVTWRSLLSFFSSKGLSTGVASSGALLVDGKLLKCGTKRGHDPAPEVENRISWANQCEEGVRTDHQTSRTEVISSPNSKKLKESVNEITLLAVYEKERKTIECSDIGPKRKNWLENFSPLIKRARVDGRYSKEFPQGLKESKGCITMLRCCYDLSGAMKRMREDNVLASSCKKTR